jgi:hypothetical protein
MRIFASVLALFWSGLALAAQSGAVDRTFTAKGDVTGDGIAELITVHIVGASREAAFKWTVTIAGLNGTTIYRIERDDSAVDKFFMDKGFEEGCSDYVSCKERYYFHDIPKAIFASIRPSATSWRLDESELDNLRGTVRDYFVQHDMSTEGIDAIVSEMRTILQKPGFHVLAVPVSPAASDAPMIWVPSVRAFIPYYRE